MNILPTPLRKALQDIADRATPDRAKEQVGLIAGLAAQTPHHIRIVQETIPGEPEAFRLNPYAYALGFAADLRAERLAARYGNRGLEIDPRLIRWMLRGNFLETVEGRAGEGGDLVVYTRKGDIVHAGRFENGALQSKWSLGQLWRHNLEEVPLSFGDEATIYRPRHGHTFSELLFRHAKEAVPAGEASMIDYIEKS